MEMLRRLQFVLKAQTKQKWLDVGDQIKNKKGAG